jgi:splicing factor 3A subunit 2
MEERAGARSNVSTAAEIKRHGRERTRRLLYEAYGLSRDPHLELEANGRLRCRLCKTRHSSELNYVKHREGKKHKRRLPREQRAPAIPEHETKSIVKGNNAGFAIIIDLPLARERPTFRFVSGLEQNAEEFNDEFQYVVFVCAPYESFGFRIPRARIIDELTFEAFDPEKRIFTLHFFHQVSSRQV